MLNPRGTVLLTFRTAILLAFLPASLAFALPNLAPYQPSGWSDKIVVSSVTGTNIGSSPLTATDTLFVDWAVINNGSTATAVRYYTELYVDGSLRTTWYSDPPVNPNFYRYVEDSSIGSLPAGTHTIRIRTDSTGVIAESNETDNEYTKTITVTGTGAPNLTPYQPSEWSDRIVVSRTTGTNSDSSPLTPADTLYVDWAVINSGSTATGARFYTELYVDGSLRTFWYSDPPVNPNFYEFVEDYSIGSLPTGTHTIRIKTDSAGAIPESNETDNEYTKTIVVTSASQACTPGPGQLCLNSGRFRVQVNWRVPSQGTSGVGTAIPLTGGDTGYFWFFNSANVELMVKVLDGRGVNGKFWVFYGALSDVEYTLTVTDTATGSIKSYFNPQGRMASVADTSAFASSTSPTAASLRTALPLNGTHVPERTRGSALAASDPIAAGAGRPLAVSFPFSYSEPSPTAAPCVPGSTNLCLNSSRFAVRVTWRVPTQGTSGVGTAVPLTSDTGYFWFFNSANVELVIKVLDGTGINGKFWVFFGALSDVEYTITVTDTATGAVKTYTNPSGRVASVADTVAFSPTALLETIRQTISARFGGTLRLPSGSSVSIPAGAFTTDQFVTLSLMSSLPKQPPSGVLESIGPALVLIFDSRQTAPPQSRTGNLNFTIRYGATLPARLTGSGPLADVVGQAGSGPLASGVNDAGSGPLADVDQDNFIGGIPISCDSSSACFAVPLSTMQNAQSISAASVNLSTQITLAPPPRFGPRIWNGSVWLDYPQGFDPKKKTLVLTHGILSTVEASFGGCVNEIMSQGGYEQVVGFNYDYGRNNVVAAGQQFAEFLNSLQTNGGLTQIDLQAHSFGTLVALYASSLTDLRINNVILEGGPLAGTPAADLAGPRFMTVLANFAPENNPYATPSTFQEALDSGMFLDAQTGNPLLALIRANALNRHPNTNYIKVFGTKSMWSPIVTGFVFGTTPTDGMVPWSSTVGNDLPGSTLTLSEQHDKLECNSNVLQFIGQKLGNAPCTYSISQPPSQPLGSGGGSGGVTVTGTPSGCSGSWTAISQAGFITITSGSSGSGAGPATVTYSVFANSSANSRTGMIAIAGQTFTVTQAGTATPPPPPPSLNTFVGSFTGFVVDTVSFPGCSFRDTVNATSITANVTGGSGTLIDPFAGTFDAAGSFVISVLSGAEKGCHGDIIPFFFSGPVSGSFGKIEVHIRTTVRDSPVTVDVTNGVISGNTLTGNIRIGLGFGPPPIQGTLTLTRQ